MSRPRALDLYCGAGLVADGLRQAGCDVVGVDIAPQPRYPGPFIKHDALTLDMRFYRSFDFIWASPPCLKDTALKHAPGAKGDAHPDLITPTQRLLEAIGLPYVLENVETARLVNPTILCGSMFGLGVTLGAERFQLRRHRKFQTNWPLAQMACQHCGHVIGVYGGHARCRAASAGGRGTIDFIGVPDKTALMREAMGVERHLTGAEVSQGIPPAYARHVATALLDHLAAQRDAA